MGFSFTLIKKDKTGARLGRAVTPHGEFQTPVFMPVGTRAAVKAMTPEGLREAGAEIILANTYHLYLRPGHEVVRGLGGLHRFMNWGGPMLTDSGGFQVFSLGKLRKIDETGVVFSSHLDGARCVLTPESAIGVQEALGADIIMPLDECPPYPAQRAYIEESMMRTHRWAKRCKEAKTNPAQALFGIVQGGMHADLRQASVNALVHIGFDGYALGGLSVGEEKAVMREVVSLSAPLLPEAAPRYLMGVGTPEDLVEGVASGIDMFDCVMPTRNARNGTLFTRGGKLVIKNGLYERDARPVEEGCLCYACRNYSRAYLRHLFMAGEMLASMLNTAHNLYYYCSLMRRMRGAINEGRFAEFKKGFYADLEAGGKQEP